MIKKDKMDEDENSKITITRKAKRVRSPHKELFPLTSPAKKRGRKLKSTVKQPNPSKHLPPRYRTTRHIHAGKHINHSTRKKKNKICIDCKDTVVELCWMCGREEHVCEKAFEIKVQVDYDWLWVCSECYVTITDSELLVNIRETLKKRKK